MPNWLEALRLKNLFGLPEGGMVGNDLPSQGGITGRMPIPKPDIFGGGKGNNPFANIFGSGMDMNQSPEMAPAGGPPMGPMGGALSDIGSRMSQMYTPETAASDRFNKMIDEAPVRNKPGFFRKMAAVMGGMTGGPETFDKTMYSPYYKEMEDWKTKIGPAQQAATLERQSNVNERTLAYQSAATQLREEAQRAKETNDTRRADIAQQRADVYEYKAKNPNLQFNFTGPTVKVSDPATGKIADTGIPTGNLSEADKMSLQQEHAMERVERQGEIRGDLQEDAQAAAEELARTRGEEARRTRATPSGASRGRDGELPTQTRVRQFNAARELWNSRPDLRQFIRIGNPGSNDFSVTPPSEHRLWGHQGPNQQQFEEINAAIYGGAMSRQAAATTTKRTVRNRTTGQTKTQVSTDGGKTWKDE